MAVMADFMLCLWYHNKNKGSDYTEDKERKKSREEGGRREREREKRKKDKQSKERGSEEGKKKKI